MLPATPSSMLKSGNANVMTGSIVQSNTHKNEAIFDNFNKRSNSVTFVVALVSFANALLPPAVIDENRFNEVDDNEDALVVDDDDAMTEEEVEE